MLEKRNVDKEQFIYNTRAGAFSRKFVRGVVIIFFPAPNRPGSQCGPEVAKGKF